MPDIIPDDDLMATPEEKSKYAEESQSEGPADNDTAASDSVTENQTLAPPAAPAPMPDEEGGPSHEQIVHEDHQAREKPKTFVEQKVGALTFAGIPMATVAQVKPFVNNMIYGQPGAGKTHVAATGALSKHLAPMLYVNAEAGANTLLKFRAKVGDNLMVIPDPMLQSGIRWDQFEAVYDELDRQCYNSKDKPDFRTVTIDTGTELQKINMDDVMARAIKRRPDHDPDVPDLHDWGASGNAMRKYMRLFRNLPMNFIFLCHETVERDNKGIQWKRPDLPGKQANQVAGLFDQVMYLYTKEGEKGDESKATVINRYLLTGALEGYVTKDRSGNLPLVVTEPNMHNIYELIHS
jgi:hypothetical protein